MRISDWSSDVCSSDLGLAARPHHDQVDVVLFGQARDLLGRVAQRKRLAVRDTCAIEDAPGLAHGVFRAAGVVLGGRLAPELAGGLGKQRSGDVDHEQRRRRLELAGELDDVPGGAIAGAASVDGEQYVHCILLVWGRVGPACSVSSPPSCRQCMERPDAATMRSEEHTSELQSLMRISYAVFCL